jgi:hypothetical protein
MIHSLYISLMSERKFRESSIFLPVVWTMLLGLELLLHFLKKSRENSLGFLWGGLLLFVLPSGPAKKVLDGINQMYHHHECSSHNALQERTVRILCFPCVKCLSVIAQ